MPGPGVIYGLGGDDTLVGFAGNDTLDGGTGNDTADYSTATSSLVAVLNAKTTNGYANGGSDVGSDTLIGIENITGGSGSDYLYVGNGTGTSRSIEAQSLPRPSERRGRDGSTSIHEDTSLRLLATAAVQSRSARQSSIGTCSRSVPDRFVTPWPPSSTIPMLRF